MCACVSRRPQCLSATDASRASNIRHAETNTYNCENTAVTDRGPIEALVPVTRVLQNTIELMSDGPDKRSLQVMQTFLSWHGLFNRKTHEAEGYLLGTDRSYRD